jgi:4-hydroxy-tetrahydrodipicolinate synthase
MRLDGTVVPMATPTDRRRGTVDEGALERFTERLVDRGVHGLFSCSSIGEFPSLTDEQRASVVRTVVAAADGEVPVVAGCCDTSVEEVVGAAVQAEAAGADAAVVVVPYYLGTDQRGLMSFFEAVADGSPLPVLLYNIPALAGNDLAVETVAELAAHQSIVGLKDTSGDLDFLHGVIARTPTNFAVYQGATELASASLQLGADGLIAGPANVFPGELAALYEQYRAGDHDAVARTMREVVAPLVAAMGDVPTAAAVKILLAEAGLDAGAPLPPLPVLDDAERERLVEQYREVAARVERAPLGDRPP